MTTYLSYTEHVAAIRKDANVHTRQLRRERAELTKHIAMLERALYVYSSEEDYREMPEEAQAAYRRGRGQILERETMKPQAMPHHIRMEIVRGDETIVEVT